MGVCLAKIAFILYTKLNHRDKGISILANQPIIVTPQALDKGVLINSHIMLVMARGGIFMWDQLKEETAFHLNGETKQTIYSKALSGTMLLFQA